jgi:hypothetical protein
MVFQQWRLCFKEQVGTEQYLALEMGPVNIVQKVKDFKTVICVRLLRTCDALC